VECSSRICTVWLRSAHMLGPPRQYADRSKWHRGQATDIFATPVRPAFPHRQRHARPVATRFIPARRPPKGSGPSKSHNATASATPAASFKRPYQNCPPKILRLALPDRAGNPDRVLSFAGTDQPSGAGDVTMGRTWGDRPVPSDLAMTQTPLGLCLTAQGEVKKFWNWIVPNLTRDRYPCRYIRPALGCSTSRSIG